MSGSKKDLRDARVAHAPGWAKRVECPECGHLLPLDSWTECDRCGAHLSLKWEVEAPAIDP